MTSKGAGGNITGWGDNIARESLHEMKSGKSIILDEDVNKNSKGEDVESSKLVTQDNDMAILDEADTTSTVDGTELPESSKRYTTQTVATIEGTNPRIRAPKGTGETEDGDSVRKNADEAYKDKSDPYDGEETKTDPDTHETKTEKIPKSNTTGKFKNLTSNVANLGQQFVDTACQADTLIHGFVLAVKLFKLLSMARLGVQLLTVADSIRAAADGTGHGPSPEQVSAVANSLTAVFTTSDNKTRTLKSGTDSFWYHTAADYRTGGFSLKYNGSGTTGQNPGSTSSWTNNYSVSLGLGGGGAFANKLGGGALGGVFDSAYNAIYNTWQGVTFHSYCNFTNSANGQMLNTFMTGIGLALTFIPGVGIAKQMLELTMQGAISFALNWVMNKGVEAMISSAQDWLKNDFLKKPFALGENFFDSSAVGVAGLMGITAGAGGNAPLNATDAKTYLAEMNDNNRQIAKIQQATASPFDIYNNDTFVGSIVGNFVASIYSNGDSPLGMMSSLFGMFGSNFANLINHNSGYTSALDDSYVTSCNDLGLKMAGIASDPACNPIYGMPNQYNMDIEDVMNQIPEDYIDPNGTYGLNETASLDEIGLINPTDNSYFAAGSTIKDFLDACITRNAAGKFTLFGETTGDMSSAGANCLLNNQNKLLYNFIQFYRINHGINQGSSLGMEAAGAS